MFDSDSDVEKQIKGLLTPASQRLDLRRAPLMQLRVAQDHNFSQWYVALHIHHIIGDNTSQGIITSEVVADLAGHLERIPESVPYRSHVAQALAYACKHDAERFFRDKLGEINEPTAPFGLLDVHGDGSRIEEAREELESTWAQRIRVQARRLGVGAATLFHAAWGLVVAHTSGRDDVVFGSVLLGRMQGSAGAQRILGMFINTLPLRLRLRRVSAKELIEQTQQELVGLLSHEQASLAVAQRCSGIVGSAPLFTTLLNYRHEAPDPESEWSSVVGVQVLASYNRTNYPITLSVDDLAEGFVLSAQTDWRIDPARITGYLRTAVQSLVKALEAEEPTPALGLSILPDSERQQLLKSFNATRAEYPRQQLIHELFEEQVRRTPNALAVLHDRQSLTYAELNDKANQLARYLSNQGIGPDSLVGICVERGLKMVVGLLGTLKAGGAYLPLDPNYPLERLQYMLEDATPQVVLTQEELRAVLPASQAQVIALDTKLKEVAGYVRENLPAAELGLTPRNLVYVIYTSGSTGRPKGTAMAHGSMVNLIEWHRRDLGAAQGQRVLQFAALSFDVAFQETFSTLCTGGTLVLLDEWMRRDVRALADFLQSHAIQRMFVPPLMLQTLAEHGHSTGTVPDALQDIITAGEALRVSPEIVSLFKRLKGSRLHNHYGPTETHVVTSLTLAGEPDQWPTLPAIGRPIANTQMYVLDEQHQPVPLGVVGEIYIGGTGVARGYLRRPELTSQRFIEDPFSSDPQARLYKTGDLGRWRGDGVLEYLGRNDDQVKIRGFRVELGEIEARLTQHERVKEAAVVAREDAAGEKRLVAYVTPREEPASAEALRAYLKGLLPEYMVPSAFVMLQSLPLSPNGKLNRRGLPAPDLDAYATRQYEPPQGEIEQALAHIWQELLRVERIGRHDNFFELGGHSVLAMQMMVRVRSSLAEDIPMRWLFEHRTLRSLAAKVDELSQARLFEAISDGGSDVLRLLEEVGMMSEREAQQLVRELAKGGRP